MDKIPSGLLDKHVDTLFNGSGITQMVEAINPMDMYDQNKRVTRMGEGALPSLDSVPKEARAVNPSQMLMIDPIRSPESLKVGVDQRFARNVKRGPNNLVYTKVRDVKSGEEVWVSSHDLPKSVVAFESLSNTKDRFVPAIVKGKTMEYVDKKDIQYEALSGDDMFNDFSQLMPLKSGVKGMRLLMGCLAPDTDLLIKRNLGYWYGKVKDYVWQDGDQTRSVDNKGTESWEIIRKVVENTQQTACLKVKLASGRTLTTTTNHKWVTMGQDGQLQEVLAQDLAVGTPVPRAGSLPLIVSQTSLNISDTTYGKWGSKDLALDFDTGWIFGLYLAEGCLIKCSDDKAKLRGTVDFAACSPEIRQRIFDFFDKLGVHHSDGKTNIRINWLSLATVLQHLFGTGSFVKQVPSMVFEAPEEFRKGLLSGYLAGDGGVYIRRKCARVMVGSRSNDLINGMQLVCTSLGIDTTVAERSVVQKPFYVLQVRIQDLSKLPKIYSDHKDARLQELRLWSGKKSYKWIPKYTSLHEKICAVTKRKDQFRHRSYVDQHTKETLSEKFTSTDCSWIGSDVLWDSVVSVTPAGTFPVTYDLDLDDKTFLCGNGVYVHNSKYTSSALPVKGREVPFVSTEDSDGTPAYERLSKKAGNVFTDIDGVITEVTPDSITIQDAAGKTVTKELFNNHPFPRKTSLTNIPQVKPGDPVKAGDLLASTNFTDSKGKLALGSNLRVGYYMADGHLFEDSVVISEDMAKKMTSEHSYNHSIDTNNGIELNKTKFTQLFPGKFTPQQLAKLDSKGVVKKGTVLQPGDPVFIGVKVTPPGPGNMGRGSTQQFVEVWEHDHDGEVTDTAKTKKGFSTYIKTEAPMEVGDKLASPAGAKGVVARILPTDQMPRDSQGKPLELLLNPMGIASRTNSALIVNAVLGKIAEKTGKPYVLKGFNDQSMVEFAKQELAKNNLTDREEVFDPLKGVNVPDVFVGNSYWYKMQQTSESKGKSKALASYTQEDIPIGKHLGDMEWAALLGHNATENIKDLKLVKGRRNDDYWRSVKLGQTPTAPGTPIVYDKFKQLLSAAGIQMTEDKNTSRIFGMTNKQAQTLTGTNELTTADTYNATTFKPIPNGLFDPDKTGSLVDGKRWSFYKLPEPLPNPVMEEPIRAFLGVTKKDFDEIIAGNIPLHGKTGGLAIKEVLSRVNLEDVMNKASETIKSGATSKRDKAIKLYTYANAMKKQGVRPEDFMMDRVPVLPPAFRPITANGGMTMVADPNYMYKALADSISDFKDSKDLPKEMQNASRKGIYDNYRALVGITDPTQDKLVEKKVGGILDQLLSKGSPKTSFVQRRLIGTNIDLYGLAAVSLNPALRLDEIGLPEKEAWDLYAPFIVRDLVKRGMSGVEAVKAIKTQDERAYKALQNVVKERPVILNRAPTLHKYSMMAMKPVLVKGHAIQVPPAIHAPFTLDHDGDTMSYSVPVSPAAVKEAYDKLLPSKNLISIASDRPTYVPSQEYTMGAYFLSKQPAAEKVKTFRNWQDAVKAYKTGEIRVDTPVSIG